MGAGGVGLPGGMGSTTGGAAGSPGVVGRYCTVVLVRGAAGIVGSGALSMPRRPMIDCSKPPLPIGALLDCGADCTAGCGAGCTAGCGGGCTAGCGATGAFSAGAFSAGATAGGAISTQPGLPG